MMLKYLGKKSLVPLSLMSVLGCTSITWIATTAVKPSISLAQPLEINLPLQRQGAENYQNFILRGESLAQSAVNDYFRRYPRIEAIKMVIMGENQGAIAPVLSLKVTRQGWTSDPQVRRWGSYYQDSKFLLGFEQPSSKPSPVTVEKPKTPATPPQTASEPQDKPKKPPETPPIAAPEPQPEPTPPTPTDRVRDAGRTPPPPDEGD